MWTDEFPSSKDLNTDPLTPAEKRREEQRRLLEEWENAPRFGDMRLTGPTAGQSPTRRQQGAMQNSYMPIQSIVAGHSQRMGDLLNDAGNEVESTIQRENDSRVAQLREMRRMDHEKELEKMRQDTERMKVDAMIKRLNGNVVRFPGGSITLG